MAHFNHQSTDKPFLTYDEPELVRGLEKGFLARFMPMTREQNLALDLSKVRRIDAAGISALLSLYVNANRAGRCFQVVNPSARVTELLTLVGLDHVLVRQQASSDPCSGSLYAKTAA